MANYYTQLYANLRLAAPAERAWALQQLAEDPITELPRFMTKDPLDLDPDADEYIAFGWSVVEAAGEVPAHIAFCIDESGNLNALGYFVQQFLKQFAPHDYWQATWALVCDKDDPEGFGGGGMFVTAAEVKLFDSHAYIYEQFEQYHGAVRLSLRNRFTPTQMQTLNRNRLGPVE